MMTKASAPPSTAHLALPFFDDAHRALADGLLPWAAAQEVDERDDRAACRDWVQRLGDGGWLRYCVPRHVRRRARTARLARPRAAARDARLPLAARRLRVRDAGPGQRRDHTCRHAGAARQLPERRWPRGEQDRGLRAQRARSGLRRGRDGNARRSRPPTAGSSTARRPGSATAASPTSTASSPRPTPPAARAASRPSSSMQRRPASTPPRTST